jgi:hybrid cluster-associated redox disulfide protein
MLYYFYYPWYFINVKFRKGNKSMTKISKDMGIMDIVTSHPETLEVFAKFGMGCIGCAAARFENLEAGAKVHGIDPEDLVAELNAVIENANK